jgi:hypothetical protein
MAASVRHRERRRTSGLGYGAIVATLACFVVLEGIAGARRSPLVPVLPPGATTPRWTAVLARWFGFRDAGSVALTVIAIALIAAAGLSLAVLLVEAWRGRVGVTAVLLATVAALGMVVAGPVLLSRDVTSYAAYGRMLAFHHANPYLHPPSAFPGDPYTASVSREWLGARSVYGPVFTLISAAIARAGGDDVGRTLLLFRALAAVATLGVVGLVTDVARTLRPGRAAFAAGLVGLNPVVVVHTVGGGHNDPVMALFLAAATWTVVSFSDVHRSSRRVTAGAATVTLLLTVATLVKAVAALPLVVWLVFAVVGSPRFRTRALAMHVAVIAVASLLLFAPFMSGAATLHPILGAAGRQGWASPAAMVARLIERAAGASVGPTVGTVVKAAFVAVLVALVVAAMPGASARGTSAAVRSSTLVSAWATSVLVLALTVPYLLPWYAMWFLPLLPFVDDVRQLVAGVALAALLSLTGIPTEPAVAPAAWRDMVSAVHYGAAASALAILLVVAASIVSQRAGAMTTSRSPNARA